MIYEKGNYFVVPNRKQMLGRKYYEQVIYYCLCARANEKGLCFPSLSVLVKDTGLSKPTILKGVKGLETFGFISKTSGDRTSSNLYQINLIEVVNMKTKGSQRGNQEVVNVETCNDTQINNNQEQHSAEAQEKPPKYSEEGAEIIKAFEEVDPKNKTYYSNKTQRASADFLIKEYGLDIVLQVIKILPKINTQKLFIGQITTPFELKERWMKLRNKLEELKAEKIKTKSAVAFH